MKWISVVFATLGLLLSCFGDASDKGAFPNVYSRSGSKSISTTLARITNGISSQQSNLNSRNISFSDDGRYAVFQSDASNLISGDTNGVTDVFLFDSQTSTMTRLSNGLSSAEANAQSFDPVISGDGNYAVFVSFANNLVAGDTNGVADVFRVNLSSGAISRVSVDSSSVQGNNASGEASISRDGNLISYTSHATNLIGSDANDKEDIFVRNVSAGTTTIVSVSTSSTQGDGDSHHSKISADGTVVVFSSHATNLVSGDTNGCLDIFARVLSSSNTTIVSTSSSGVQGNRNSEGPDISQGGQYVVFQSSASNLVSSDTNGYVDVFLKNRSTGVTTLVSQKSNGSQVTLESVLPSISNDGRFVVFESRSPDYVSWDNNAASDVFIRDLASSITTPFSTLVNDVVGNAKSMNAKISGDGSKIGFTTYTTNLVTPDTNNRTDVLIRDNPLNAQVVNVEPIADLDESAGSQNAFLFKRFGSTASSLTVYYSTTGTAISGVDYTTLSGSVTIPASASSISVPVNVLTDSLVEGNESIIATLSENANYTIGGKNSAAVNILADDLFIVNVVASDNVFYEDGLNRATFTISRTGGTWGDLIVNLSSSGSATIGLDYVGLPTSIIIPDGQSSVDVTVTGLEDQIGEGDETVVYSLASGSMYAFGSNNTATATLKDNDSFEVNVIATDSIADESNTSNTGNFRIDRGATSYQNLTVQYAIRGTATNGSDYSSIPTSVVISAPNAYVDIPIVPISDGSIEGFENVTLEILGGQGYSLGNSRTSTVVIREDASLPVISVDAIDASATEDGSNTGTFRFSRSGSTSGNLPIAYSIAGTAMNGSDYSTLTGTATIVSGQSYVDVTVAGAEDSVVEEAESVIVASQSGATYIVDPAASQAEVLIADNEVPSVRINRVSASSYENQRGRAKLVISREGNLSAALTINLSYSGTATSGSDYTSPGSTVVIPSGEKSKSIEIAAISDNQIEGNESVIVTVGSSANYTIATDSSTQVSVIDGSYKVLSGLLGVVPNQDVRKVSVSDDGRYVVFESSSSNLVAGDTNGVSDIFRVDTVSSTITRVLALSGVQPNGASRDPSISENGQFVVFSSKASNFNSKDFNLNEDVFLYDFTTSQITYVSNGAQGGDSVEPSISSNGSFVVFSSAAVNLVDGDTNGVADIFLFTRNSGSLIRVNTKFVGQFLVQMGYPSSMPSISDDGKIIGMHGRDVLTGALYPTDQILIVNLATSTTYLPSIPTFGTGIGESRYAKVSANGESVVFQSTSSNLISGDLNSVSDIFSYSTKNFNLTLVSSSEKGWIGDKSSSSSSIDKTGKYVSFITSSRNLGGVFNCASSVYIKDIERNGISLVDNGSFGSCSAPVAEAAISGSGKFIVSILPNEGGFREIILSSNPLP